MLLMRKTLHRPALTIFSFLALSAGAFMMAGNLGTETLPVSDDGTITISLKLSNDASLEAAERKTVLVEDFVLSMAEAGAIEHVTSAVGAGGMDQSPFKSKITVTLKDVPDRPATADVAGKIRAYLNAMPGIEFSVLATRPGFGRDPIEIHVKGQDMSELFTIAGEILLKGKDVPGIIDLQPATEMGRPELRIVPMRWNLARLGVDISGLTRTMKGYLNGNKAGELRSGGSECDIVVRLCPEKTRDIYAMNQMPIMTKRGPVPLGEMAAMEWGSAPTEIRRIERERTLMITGNVQNISAGEGIAKMREILGSLTLPAGYSAQMAGEADEMDDIGGEMAWAVIFAVTATYLIVASILGSWAYALVILLTVPMAAIGVVPLMLATGANMSLFAGIGVVMLIGLVVNNAIVVVDCAESLRKNENLPPGEAIERACEVRFKSVAMGAVTSIVSFMPLALSTGRGSEFRAPIAAVAIGGLAAGGLLALLVIPAAFALCWKIKDRLGFAKA
jgi:HAE1 family hydrophobic/amphiphilic exporter-1